MLITRIGKFEVRKNSGISKQGERDVRPFSFPPVPRTRAQVTFPNPFHLRLGIVALTRDYLFDAFHFGIYKSIDFDTMSSNQSQKAYEHIRSKLLDSSLPPGSRLSYGGLGKEIGVSATPVREAVGQLASEGLIELIPQLGAVVRALSREEAIELYETREALEAYAAAKAAERASDAQIKSLENNLAALKKWVTKVNKSGKPSADKKVAKEFHALDLAFHMTIIEASRNRRMLKVVGDSHILTRIFQANRHEFAIEILEATQAEHEAIFTAIKSKNAKAAHDAMQRHIQNSLVLTLNETDNDTTDRWWTA